MNNQIPLTPHGHCMYEISSLIQKAIRRGDERYSFYAASQMNKMYHNYLWKRLLTTSAEDCLGYVTQHIIDYRKEDNIEDAVATLVSCSKNRDADWFACNIMVSKYKREIGECNGLKYGCVTKNGHDVFHVADVLEIAIKEHDDELAGYCTTELCIMFKPFFWKKVFQLSKSMPEEVKSELRALKQADDYEVKYKENPTIFVGKAVVILLRMSKYPYTNFIEEKKIGNGKMNIYGEKYLVLPEYTYDCHTYKGKRNGKTARDFVVTEQEGLNPLVKCDYDEKSWELDFMYSETGRGTQYNQKCDPKLIKTVNEGIIQPMLF